MPDPLETELIEFRRDLHAHPELSWAETRTTAQVSARLAAAGVSVRTLEGTGLVAEIGAGEPIVALRGDLDALPVPDLIVDPWVSTVAGVAHACGHDVHTSALLGAGLLLQRESASLPGRVRLIFQPAEEVMPGGALSLVEQRVLDGVSHIFGLHCDPSIDVGQVGLREGPITGASDALSIQLSGRGGHTSRPHLTHDLTFALGKLVTELPAVVSRRFDPRAGVSMVWGHLSAGSAPNVIPSTGSLGGTIRMLDVAAWGAAEEVVRTAIAHIIAPYGVVAEVSYRRGVPPVDNAPEATRLFGQAITAELGAASLVPTAQSLGGEDFGWYLQHVSGAMGRLGTRTPGGTTYDLHQGDLSVDERAVMIGARVLAAAAREALSRGDLGGSEARVTGR